MDNEFFMIFDLGVFSDFEVQSDLEVVSERNGSLRNAPRFPCAQHSSRPARAEARPAELTLNRGSFRARRSGRVRRDRPALARRAQLCEGARSDATTAISDRRNAGRRHPRTRSSRVASHSRFVAC
jgi:hypothetical protein